MPRRKDSISPAPSSNVQQDIGGHQPFQRGKRIAYGIARFPQSSLNRQYRTSLLKEPALRSPSPELLARLAGALKSARLGKMAFFEARSDGFNLVTICNQSERLRLPWWGQLKSATSQRAARDVDAPRKPLHLEFVPLTAIQNDSASRDNRLSQLIEASPSAIRHAYSTFHYAPHEPYSHDHTFAEHHIATSHPMATSIRATPRTTFSRRKRSHARHSAIPRASSSENRGGSSERARWDFGRFLRTVLYWNNPSDWLRKPIDAIMGRSGEKKTDLVTLDGKPISEPQKEAILVVGASGGLGKRVARRLAEEGKAVRALCRDPRPLHEWIGDEEVRKRIEVAQCDIAQPQTLQDGLFSHVVACVDCSAAKVGPKEGDDEQRSKYYQGIKFFDPEVKETPELVEYKGRMNLLQKIGERIGKSDGYQIYPGVASESSFGSLDDVVMGGVSESQFLPGGVFKGIVRTENSGGFASVRCKDFDPPLDLSAYEGIRLRVKGDGFMYKLTLKTSYKWDTVTYAHNFETVAGEWQTIDLPFRDFVANFRAKPIEDAAPVDSSHIVSVQLMLSKFKFLEEKNPTFEPGPFELQVDSISTYLPESTPSRMVMVSSAGSTRWNRPGIEQSDVANLSSVPIVQLNEMLNYLLTYKLYGEDVVRSSGVPHTVVRPCALTEEPGGMPLELGQGDNFQGKISREDVADLCVAALRTPELAGVTLEVRSTIPTQEEFTGPDKPLHRDWGDLARQFNLRPGVTGKTIDGVYTGDQPEEEALKAATES